MSISENNKRRYIDVYRGDAKSYLNLQWWIGKSDMEIVGVQLYVRDLEVICDFEVFLIALENVLGRPVLEWELSNRDLLIDEFESKYFQWKIREGLPE